MNSKQIANVKNQEFNINRANTYVEHIDKDDIKKILGTNDFEFYMNAAYEQHGIDHNRGLGYSIRWNPHTGQKEMYVAGSQGWKDWLLNAVDTVYYGAEKIFGKELDAVWTAETDLPPNTRPNLTQFDFYRNERSKKLSKIAKEEGVAVVYGHSRGGAVVADLDFTGRKVGVDAAMIIANNKDMENYHRQSVFDEILGATGKNNIPVDTGYGMHWGLGQYAD